MEISEIPASPEKFYLFPDVILFSTTPVHEIMNGCLDIANTLYK